jgi:hypothetical protein
MAAGLCISSLRVAPAPIFGEERRGSAKFLEHTEELIAKKIGDAAESPSSYAEQMYELNGGDSITANDVLGAQAAAAAISSNGVGAGKYSTTSWFALGPTNATYPAFLNRHGSAYTASGRITALANTPTCVVGNCPLWLAAAGGGVWKTNDALAGNGNWKNVSDGTFTTGAIGALTYDAAHNTLYAGTGEDAASGDSEAGLGIFKSTDGGQTWAPLAGNSNFFLRCIRQISIDQNDPTGNTFYVSSGRGVRGISSTTAGATSTPTGGAPVGVWKTTDGGASFTLLAGVPVVVGTQSGQQFLSSFGSTRGATDVAVDPTHPGVVYASAYNLGVWRSTDSGATWTNIHPCSTTNGCNNVGIPATFDATRSEFALATTPDGHTRMYQGEGDSGPGTLNAFGLPYGPSQFYVADSVDTGAPSFVNKTSSNVADAGYATYDFCTGQCWYDQRVVSPAGYPNMVYVLGSFTYGESHNLSNARAVLLSQDGGDTFTDLTDAATGTDANHDGLHPDQHAFATNPNNPLQFWEGSDGGIMRSDGTLVNISSRCAGRNLSPARLARCQQLLSAVPGTYTNLNNGLSTLQFQSLSVNPANSKNIQGGTQDNGTFETSGSSTSWPQTIFGDGGLSGFDATDKTFRFHTYFNAQVDVNFNGGQDRRWDWIADSFFIPPANAEGRLFYFPIITDTTVSGTMFAGLGHVYRTLSHGGPSEAYLDQHCNEFFGDFTVQCGDWVPLGLATSGGRLTCTTQAGCTYNTAPSKGGGSVGWISRTSADNSTLWAATTIGRLFISKNANATPETAVTFTRLDSLAANSPARAISSISIDPSNPNTAYVSYLSYNGKFAASPPGALPGHVFRVDYNPGAGTATWTNLEGTGTPIGDQPVNAVAFDATSGDLFAATDFGVFRLPGANGATAWTTAAQGLPVVTISGLTLNAGARQLLGASHGRGAFQLTLP